MKCPKCDYLGFETGDRCKNCGYDFSLVPTEHTPVADEHELPLQAAELPAPTPRTDLWLRELEHALGTGVADKTRADGFPAATFAAPHPAAPLPLDTLAPPAKAGTASRLARRTAEPSEIPPAPPPSPALPLFTRDDDDDRPLITLPAAPRAPLAVRRTPDAPRLRTVARPPREVDAEPALTFQDDSGSPEFEPELAPADFEYAEQAFSADAGRASGAGTRIVAAVIDHVLLLAIDASVVYFTLRMAALAPAEWQVLPLAPLATFLVLIKVAYFGAFTAIGGQTIGKMATGIRVVGVGGPLDPSRAITRTLAGFVSLLTLGLGFIPAFFGDHRALHDRLAGTRVVAGAPRG